MLWRAFFIHLALALPLIAQVNAPVPQAHSGFRIAGTVVSATGGQRLEQAQVTIVDTQKPSVAESMMTGVDGLFHFENLAAGKYVLTGSCRGYVQQSFNEHFQ